VAFWLFFHMAIAADTNNDSAGASRRNWLLAAWLLVALLRLWRLPEAGPVDYDSVRNWQVIQELAQGNFTHLFHHGSPGFLLLYVPLAACTRSFVVFQAVNAGLGLLGLGWFSAWVARQAQLSGPLAAALLLLGGTSLLLTFSGRDFTMNSASLVLCAGLLSSHFERLRQPHPRALLRAAGWLAAGLCVNYKFLFTIPILLVLELWQADGLWRPRGTWWRVLLLLAAPYVALGAVGVAAGLPWYRWAAFYVRTVVPPAANMAGRQSTLHLDLFYYVRYLAAYESPLLLAGLCAALLLAVRYYRTGQLQRRQPLPLLVYLLVWALCFLAGMSLLIKAPRGLLFAYLPLSALAVLTGRELLSLRALLPLVGAAVVLNVWRIQQLIYQPLPSRYPQVAGWLKAHQATSIGSTVSLGLAPFLAPSQTLHVITDERQLSALHGAGAQYVVLDGYWRVAGLARFDSLRQQQPLVSWPAPELQSPLLFLEHSEFTGLGFDETLTAQRAATTDSNAIRIYRLQ